jgi:hypothetical protein
VIKPVSTHTYSVDVAFNGGCITAEDKLQVPLLTLRLPRRGLVTWPVVWAHVRAHIGAHVRTDIGAAVVVSGAATDLAPSAAVPAVAVVLSPQSSEPLLLGVCVDVCTDDESDDVEEGHPCGLGEELLGKGQRDGGDDPADFHDRPEASLDSRADLVERTGACDERHGDEVYAVLDGGDLELSAPCY